MTSNELLVAQGISFKYFENAKTNVLDSITLSLSEGTITLLCGKSGSGKSTLAYILAGLYPANGGHLLSGRVMVDGLDIHSLSAKERVKYVGMMFQNCDLQFCMDTLRNELQFCSENIGEQIDVELMAQKVGISHLLDRNFHTLSGGEKQKCALCCILALQSKVLILDEAFANVDTTAAKELIGIVKKSGLTVLAIDHQISLWEGVYDRVVRLGQDDPSPITPVQFPKPIKQAFIETRGLIVNGIRYPDFCFQKNSITAIMGKSGVGKTTLFKTLIGQHKYNGSITLEGKQLREIKRHELYAKCGLVFQNPANQFVAMTVFDEVCFSVRRWFSRLDKAQLAAKTRELLILFGLERYENYPPYLLSQGQQRRLAVLAMIAGGQQLLLLDEPTYGQDDQNIGIMMNLLSQRANEGLTVIFSTHNEKVASDFAYEIVGIGEQYV